MVAIGGNSLPGFVRPSLHQHSLSAPAFGSARFPAVISFGSRVILRAEVENKDSRAVIVNGLGKRECDCETEFDATLGNGHAVNSGIASILMSILICS